MGDATLESLNRMIDTAGRDDLTVVSTDESGALDSVLDMLATEAAKARDGLPTGTVEQALQRVHERARALAGRPSPSLTVWGRVRLCGTGEWRPAYFSPAGAFVGTSPADPWRWMSPDEEQTWQRRKEQAVVGRVWDDALFDGEDGAA